MKKEILGGMFGMAIVCTVVLVAVDRYLRKPPKRYLIRAA